jgi:hypothetical protein
MMPQLTTLPESGTVVEANGAGKVRTSVPDSETTELEVGVVEKSARAVLIGCPDVKLGSNAHWTKTGVGPTTATLVRVNFCVTCSGNAYVAAAAGAAAKRARPMTHIARVNSIVSSALNVDEIACSSYQTAVPRAYELLVSGLPAVTPAITFVSRDRVGR